MTYLETVDARHLKSSSRPFEAVELMGMDIAAVTESEAVGSILDAAAEGSGHWTVTANLDHLRRSVTHPDQRELIQSADLVVADGMPLVWASRLAGTPLPERVSGSNMVWTICEAAAGRGLSIYLLGGDEGVAEDAADVFLTTYPGLRIVGADCPPWGFEDDEQELERIEARLLEAAPDIVFVALGFPKQDLLIRRLRKVLPAASFLGVGISLSYATGDTSRAPDWVCRIGFEWAYRLYQEPTRRLADRYVLKGLPFALRLLADVATHRLRRFRRRRST